MAVSCPSPLFWFLLTEDALLKNNGEERIVIIENYPLKHRRNKKRHRMLMPTGPADQLPTPATLGQGDTGYFSNDQGTPVTTLPTVSAKDLTQEVSGSGETWDSCLGF